MTKPWNAPAAAIEESSADEHVQRCQISAGIVNSFRRQPACSIARFRDFKCKRDCLTREGCPKGISKLIQT